MIVKVYVRDWFLIVTYHEFFKEIEQYVVDHIRYRVEFPDDSDYEDHIITLDIPENKWEEIYQKYKDKKGYDKYFGDEFNFLQKYKVEKL